MPSPVTRRSRTLANTAGSPSLGPSPRRDGALRVATIPHADSYVDAVLPPGVVRVGPGEGPSPWLDAAYVADHGADVDVVHLHAAERLPAAADLEDWSEAVRRVGVPLVVTVHELHEAAVGLEAVMTTAEVVLTLTPGAADEIADRFGRTAIVVAHPSVAAADPELGAERGLVGLRLGPTSGAGPEPGALVRAALSGAMSGGGRLRVLVPAADELPLDPGVRRLADRAELELVVHPEAEWAAQLQQLHAAVLPERCGSHSRDLEICRDVGTRVVAPGCGWFTDQWSEVVTFGDDEDDGLDEVSLTAAVGAALTRPMPRPADRAWRNEQRDAVRRVHADVYAQVAGDRRWA